MRLGFLVVRDMRELPFEEVAKWGSENGFDAVDTSVENADICRKYGLEVGCTFLRANLLIPDDEERQKAQEQAMKIIEQAVSKGVRRAMISHWRQPGRKSRRVAWDWVCVLVVSCGPLSPTPSFCSASV